MHILISTLGLVLSILFTVFCISGIMALPGVIMLYAIGLSIGLILTGASVMLIIFSLEY
jgi:hypothetical protein